MGPLSYMRLVVDRNVVMWRMTVLYGKLTIKHVSEIQNVLFMQVVENYLTRPVGCLDMECQITLAQLCIWCWASVYAICSYTPYGKQPAATNC
jgi:hypothetical protein